MIVIDETAARRLVSPADAIDAMDMAFREVSRGQARNFPVVRERLLPGPDVYGIKAGGDLAIGLLGLKIGGYWTGNRARGLTNHQSTTVLTDPETGCPTALVSSNHLTGLRTAAACAIGIRELARPDARVLALIGTGGQAAHHLEAALLVRRFDRILVARAEELTASFAGPVPVEVVDAETAARSADVLITLTTAREPVVQAGWVRPGTHICAMGADTAGKQELDPAILLGAAVWVDDWAQAAALGECQHALAHGLTRESIRGTLCDVLEGKAPRRAAADEITVFDSTGMGIQDLAIAAWAVRAANTDAGDAGLPIHRIDLAR
ncbi:ornithine cyclodeaminase family protein [Azospirillum brasilense]|uniref:ornithine cyclodeaminase family protein n=1 Tax=Azospirillum brasilense TaxID=192 RepID=UPI0003A3445C|nr:ornithine cyclodeaminase family protein [Azospirillum brasilense]